MTARARAPIIRRMPGKRRTASCASRLGDRLKSLRDERDLTTADLAEAAKVDESTMASILAGDIGRPPDARLRALAKLLDVSFESLLELVPSDRRESEDVVQGSFRAEVAVSACAFAVTPPAADSNLIEVQLTPAGEFRPRDGRKMPVPAWKIDAAIAASVIDRFRARRTPPVVDYEHQTLLTEDNGQPAPAAGFVRDLIWREGQGLYAVVEATARAAEFVRNGEYRYFSPVFSYDARSGAILEIEMGALTNHPALDGMEPLALRAAARFGQSKDIDMDLLSELRALLGLDTDADETAVLEALRRRIKTEEALRAALKLSADVTPDAAVAALTAQRSPDPARFVPVAAVEELRTQLAALSSQVRAREIDDLVEPALEDGRLLPAQAAWARDLGKADIAKLRAYLDTAEPLAALRGSQTGGRGPETRDEDGLTPDELAVCRATGVAPKAFAAARA